VTTGAEWQAALERQIDGQRQKLSVWSSMLERGEQVRPPQRAKCRVLITKRRGGGPRPHSSIMI
jgi:hypothetical protein